MDIRFLLILLGVIISASILISAADNSNTSSWQNDYTNSWEDGSRMTYRTTKRDFPNDVQVVLIIFNAILVLIILAGLFGIGKKKPSLLIPYFIFRILEAIAVILVMIFLLFFEKKGLNAVDSVKTYNNGFEFLSGRQNALGGTLNDVSNILYLLIAVEILIIILFIHFAKVVYACYKEIDEELKRGNGIIYGPQTVLCNLPYTILQNQSMEPHQSINMIPAVPVSVNMISTESTGPSMKF